MENSQFIKKIDDKNIQVLKGATVPEKNTFLIEDANGKLINTLRGGAKVDVLADCIIIECPAEFPKGVTCWRCRERPEQTQPVRR